MIQVYHYAYYTSRSLALAGANLFNTDTRLMHHFFEHAMEETGHELMALNDLRELGIPIEDARKQMPPALPATEALIAYVRHLSTGPIPYKSLGYHYWIEQPYQHIIPFMKTLQSNMGLNDKQMTFYFQHLNIDQKHGTEMQKIVSRVCTSEEHWNNIMEACEKSLYLAFEMLKAVITEYNLVKEKKSQLYGIVNSIE
jgi:pyrroloquinoline quinone (PQQ) biosynthesis protein C